MTNAGAIEKKGAIAPISGTIIESVTTPLNPIDNIKQFILVLFKDRNFFGDLLRQSIHENRDYVRQLLDEEESQEIVSFGEVNKETAKNEIQEYINNHPNCRTSEIIDNLHLNPMFAMEILKELKEGNVFSSRPVESNGQL